MENKQEMTGLQRFMLRLFISAGRGVLEGYAELSKDEREKLHKQHAKRMFDRAMQNKLTRPYDENEIEYIKEGLGIKDTSD